MADASRPKHPLDPARAIERRELFGGTGAVRVWDLGPTPPPFTAALFCELDPGGRVGEHLQRTEQEIIVVVGGEAVLYVNGRAHACVEGSAVPLPLGATLAIDNASPTEVVRYVIVKAKTG